MIYHVLILSFNIFLFINEFKDADDLPRSYAPGHRYMSENDITLPSYIILDSFCWFMMISIILFKKNEEIITSFSKLDDHQYVSKFYQRDNLSLKGTNISSTGEPIINFINPSIKMSVLSYAYKQTTHGDG